MELYLEPIRLKYNPKNGRFLKGASPFNKGKKWDDFIPKEKQKIMRKNLELGRKNGNKNIGGWNKKCVIGIKDNNIFGVFESSTEAGKKLNLISRNIRKCCEHSGRKKCGGIYWFHESDYERWHLLLNNA